MANIQVKNVPDELHRRLRAHARKTNRTLGDVVLKAVEHELARTEFHDALAKRSMTRLDVSAADVLTEARGRRDGELQG